MRNFFSRWLVLAVLLTWSWCSGADSFSESHIPHPFNAVDLVMMDRVSDAQLSADGLYAAFTVLSTDYTSNKIDASIYVYDLTTPNAAPLKIYAKNASIPRWSSDGQALYYIAQAGDLQQLWKISLHAVGRYSHRLVVGKPFQVTKNVIDVDAFKLSPDGKSVLLSYAVFRDCQDLTCTRERLSGLVNSQFTGKLYKTLFVRHWDTWEDGRRSQLYISQFLADGTVSPAPVLLTRMIDGDVPSKPFGGDSEFAFSPDSKTVYFDVRVAGASEPWTTNFDVYKVPADASAIPQNLTSENKAWDADPVPSPDGKTLYYLAMKTPGFEADRFAIIALDLATGAKHEVDPKWDRSPGEMEISQDGKILYVTADDNGQHPLFSINVTSGKVRSLVSDGAVDSYSLASNRILLTRNDLKRPSDLYLTSANGSGLKQVTHFNVNRLANVKMGDFQFYVFKGANGDSVQGYVVKPVDYQPGKRYPFAFIVHGATSPRN